MQAAVMACPLAILAQMTTDEAAVVPGVQTQGYGPMCLSPLCRSKPESCAYSSIIDSLVTLATIDAAAIEALSASSATAVCGMGSASARPPRVPILPLRDIQPIYFLHRHATDSHCKCTSTDYGEQVRATLIVSASRAAHGASSMAAQG
jgi:hypothetical protein